MARRLPKGITISLASALVVFALGPSRARGGEGAQSTNPERHGQASAQARNSGKPRSTREVRAAQAALQAADRTVAAARAKLLTAERSRDSSAKAKARCEQGCVSAASRCEARSKSDASRASCTRQNESCQARCDVPHARAEAAFVRAESAKAAADTQRERAQARVSALRDSETPPELARSDDAEPARSDSAPSDRREAAARRQSGESARRCAPGMVLVALPPTDDEPGTTPPPLAPFCIDRVEVTVATYARCVSSGECTAALTPKDDEPALAACNAGVSGRDQHPINCVDWEQSAAYCRLQGKRLPTDDEWQFAALGAEDSRFPWGNAPPDTQLCWRRWGDGKANSTCAVGSFASGNSPFGVSDLSGNVEEWTSTVVGSASHLRALRGGGWAHRVSAGVRADVEDWAVPSTRSPTIGFRCAAAPLP